MKNQSGIFLFLTVLLSIVPVGIPLFAQEGFGFGFDDESGGTAGGSLGGGIKNSGVSIGGEVSAGLQLYFDDASDLDKLKAADLSDIFSGALNFRAFGANAEGVINLNLAPNFAEPEKILFLDEAYVRAFFGGFNIEGGIRKLTWGKADTLGPLDVINPLDYTDLSDMDDIQRIKIARPLIRASYGFGRFSKVEGVFVPWFEGIRFSQKGRWTPAQATKMAGDIEGKMRSDMTAQMGGLLAANPGLAPLLATIPNPVEGIPAIAQGDVLPSTLGLEYAQGGVRYTTTFGPVDLGVQYYSGYNPRPAIRLNQARYDALQAAINDYYALYITAFPGSPTAADVASAKAAVEAALNPAKLLDAAYNRYHQIGLDYAQVLWGFNVRGELAANITSDLAGDDGLVHNPALAWSFGFDRDIPGVGINVNIQANESIRLLDDKVGSDPLFDIEAETGMTSTRLIASLSRTFFRDTLEVRTTVIWGIEDMDCYIIPAVTWTKGDIALELSAGIFQGNREGELGQYRDCSFIKTSLTYSF